jgi:hypothetical protein
MKKNSLHKNGAGITFVLGFLVISVVSVEKSSANMRISSIENNGGTNDNEITGTRFIRSLENEPRNQSNDKLLVGNQPSERFTNNVELQLLNKITGKIYKIKAKIDKPVIFERLEIVPLKCWKSFPEENPENKLLLKIFETKQHDIKKKLIFYGWIFSSTPSVSGLEHSLYDVELKDCM